MKNLALAQYLKLDSESIEELEELYDDTFEYEGAEYMILTDYEADDKWNESIESYIEECVLIDIPENYRNYFDTEAFKKDCSYDGRGHTLAIYDGEENKVTFEGVTYYIYRTN